MKRHIILNSLFILFSCNFQTSRDANVIGQWRTIQKDGSEYTLEIIDNTNLLMKSDDGTIHFTYEINQRKKPYWFDFFTLDWRDTVKGIMEFIDDSTMRYQFIGGDRKFIDNEWSPIEIFKRIQ